LLETRNKTINLADHYRIIVIVFHSATAAWRKWSYLLSYSIII